MIKLPLVVATLFCSCAVLALADETPAAPNRAQQIFKQFDTNGDGGISLDEYRVGMGANISPARIGSVFKEKDRNGDGKLNLAELLYVPHDQRPPPTAAPAKKAKN